MQQTILIAHSVIGLLFIGSVLLQDRGVGFGVAVGGVGGAGFYASQRGAAKVLHHITIALCIAFFATALLYFFVPPGEDLSANSAVPSLSAEDGSTVSLDAGDISVDATPQGN